MGRGSDKSSRDDMLRRLRHREFRGVYFEPQDALVAIAPIPGSPGPGPPHIAKLDFPYPFRLFPVESGGSLIKWPYANQEFDPRHHRIEPGGWDHEHCEACNANIGAGDECWFTTDESTSILCGSCYDRRAELANE